MSLKCCLAGCGEPADTIHGGYAYCADHLGWIWELPHSMELSGDQQYVAVELYFAAIQELFDEDDWKWDTGTRRILGQAVAVARGEIILRDRDFASYAVSFWHEITGTIPPSQRFQNPDG
jgi:hypothetical protein